MLDKSHFKDLITYALILGIFFLALLTIKPIIVSIIYGILLGYIFHPLYRWIQSKVKNENLSAAIICLGLFILIFAVIVLIITSVLKQVIDAYLYFQKMDLVAIIQKLIPGYILSSGLSDTVVGSLNTAISNFMASSINRVGNLIVDSPTIALQFFVVFVLLYFCLRDGTRAIAYIKSLSPLTAENNERFSQQFKDITNSVLIGQIVVGVLQGILAGIGYFVFEVPNALLLTLITVIASIIPFIGPWLVWVPVDIYLFSMGRSGVGIGLLIYGLFFVSLIDNLLRPLIVSRWARINPGIILIGMIGGLFAFGIPGLLIGPLILAYVLLILELYRKKSANDNVLFIKKEE